MWSAIGVPVVTPSNTPDRIFTVSGSWRWVTNRDWPGRRFSIQTWMSASVSGMPGGVPSTTQPIAGPWLSPQLVNRKRVPKLLPAMAASPRLVVVAEVGQQLRQRLGLGGLHHANDVIARIDMHDLTGHAAAEVGQQEQAGIADLLRRDVALERRIELVPLQDEREIADAGRRQRLDRTGRDGVDANALVAEIGREIAHARLEGCLGHAHDVVMRHHTLGAVVGERQQAAAGLHQRHGALGDGGEGVAAHVHGELEIVGRGVEVFALELVLVGEGDGMDQEVEAAPLLLDLGEGGIDAGSIGDVARQDQLAADLLGQRPHPFLQRFTLKGEGELGAMFVARFGDSPGDRAMIGHAHDQAFFPGHYLCSSHRLVLAGWGGRDKMAVVEGRPALHIVVMIREKADPLDLFAEWYGEAEKSEPNDPSALTLATVGPDGTPSARMVLLKGYDRAGFVFYTNLEGRKGRHLIAHPKAAMLFHWKSLRRQVRLEGPVTQTTAEEADAYFATRARGSQIGAWASDQSRPLESRFALEKSVAEFGVKHLIGTVPRPPHWSGFRLQPTLIEFWNDGAFRLHDRLEYSRASAGAPWSTRTLYP